jgi:hypothetical protein
MGVGALDHAASHLSASDEQHLVGSRRYGEGQDGEDRQGVSHGILLFLLSRATADPSTTTA